MKEKRKANNSAGITLIALVITIVVLLILAGVTMSIVFGDKGVITQAQEAKERNAIAEVDELARIIYTEEIVKAMGIISDETALTKVFAELTNQGYDIKTISNVGETLEGIIVQDLSVQDSTGQNISELNVQQGKQAKVKINLDLRNGEEKHYILVGKEYYEIRIENNEVYISEEPTQNLEGNEYTIKLAPPSTGAQLQVAGTEITTQTTIVNGAEITIIAGQQTGNDFKFNVMVENTEHTKDVNIKVVANPEYATNLILTAEENKTEIEQGEALQLIATLEPNTATDTVLWSVNDGAVISNQGLLTVNADAAAGSTIVVTAKCVRSDGTETTLEDTYTLTVKEKQQEVQSLIGAFVEYDVEYTDIYYTSYEYNKSNGWRVLSCNEETGSDIVLISTGIPAKMCYDVGDLGPVNNLGWWGTSSQIKELFNITTSYNESNGPSYCMSAGLYYNFKEVLFANRTSEESNKATINSVKVQNTIYNSSNTTEKTGDELFNLYGENATVRILTKEEYNNANPSSDEIGLYRLSTLKNVLLDKDYSSSGYFFVAGVESRWDPSIANYNGTVDNSGDHTGAPPVTMGLRPVIILPSNYSLGEMNAAGAYTIVAN